MLRVRWELSVRFRLWGLDPARAGESHELHRASACIGELVVESKLGGHSHACNQAHKRAGLRAVVGNGHVNVAHVRT